MRFGDWLEYWYETYSKPKIRATVQAGYESRISLHIIPEVNSIRLNKLAQNDIQQFYSCPSLRTIILPAPNVVKSPRYSSIAL